MQNSDEEIGMRFVFRLSDCCLATSVPRPMLLFSSLRVNRFDDNHPSPQLSSPFKNEGEWLQWLASSFFFFGLVTPPSFCALPPCISGKQCVVSRPGRRMGNQNGSAAKDNLEGRDVRQH